MGYASLGSFTTRFTQLVGLPPSRLRRVASNFLMPSLTSLQNADASHYIVPSQGGLTGTIYAPSSFNGPIFVGLFPKPIPQGRPIRCVLLSIPSRYVIHAVPDGCYYILAAGLPVTKDAQVGLSSATGVLVGTSQHPILIRSTQACNQIDITLRSPQVTDPPLLLALPFI